MFAATVAAATDKATWQAGASIYTESGDYGTGSRTTTTYIPFSIRRYFEPGDLELIVPLISVTSQGQVIVVEGVPTRQGNGRAASRVTHGGLGDMVFKGRYYLVEERDYIPSIDAVGKIKFPTASRTKGLGTGEFDEGGSLEFSKSIAERYVALADAGYVIIGSPPGLELRNQWHYSLGGGYCFLPKKLLGSLTYEEYRALIAGDPNPKDLLLSAEYFATPRLRVDGGIMIGLSTTTADFGINVGAHLKF